MMSKEYVTEKNCITQEEQFESKEFALQIISKGSFTEFIGDEKYMTEVITVRLNQTVFAEWYSAEPPMNTREVYDDGPAGDAEWEAHKNTRKMRRKVRKNKMPAALGIRGRANVRLVSGITGSIYDGDCGYCFINHLFPNNETVTIAQAWEKVFTVIRHYLPMKEVLREPPPRKYAFGDSGSGKSDFTYRIKRITSGSNPVLVIIDLNQGGMSVTDNMDAIITETAADIGADHRLLIIPVIYRDSEGVFSGVHVSSAGSVNFYSLVPGRIITDEQEAIQAVTQREEPIQTQSL